MPFKQMFKLSAAVIGLTVRIGSFIGIALLFYVIYEFLLGQVFDGSRQIFPLFGLWVLTAYIVIPRIHRILTKYYLPNYFVGRIRSPSGFLSDPVNLAFFGSQQNVHDSMTKAGWVRADDMTPKTLARVVYCAALRKSYPSAPVGDMFLFSRRYDFAYQQEVKGSPSERHHVRFWEVPKGWRLPGGHESDWLASATYDTHLGFKISTGQIDHYINKNVDIERDYIVKTLKKAKQVKHLEVVEHFTEAYHDRSNGGDRIETDGALPFISL